jgi:hypothetical protein
VRDLLTPALAGVNPKAYIAHFKRLDDEARRTYLGGLSAADLKAHFKTVGENATVGLIVSASRSEPTLEATVGGSPLGQAGLGEMFALQERALMLGREIEAKAFNGMLVGSLSRLERIEAVLRALKWTPKTVVLAGDSGDRDCAPVLGWSMRGTIADTGTFHTPNEPLLWDEREQVKTILGELAQRWGAVLDVRL